MSDYIPADMVMHNYGLPDQAWEQLQRAYQEHFDSHPQCELCNRRPSVRITPLGLIRAACLECIEQQRQEMIDCYNQIHQMCKEEDGMG